VRARRPVVYVLACRGGALYTGWTYDLAARIAAHLAGVGSRYTRANRPLALRAWWECADKGTALREEARFKRLRRTEKLALLGASEVFGRSLRKAPHLGAARRHGRLGREMPTNVAPTGAELDTLAQEAESVRARVRTNKGDLVFTFYPHEARLHSAAFIKLARAAFYDGLTFHRVEPGFVVQGGCPSGTGTGGHGYNLPAEFSALPHVRGTVAMARSSNPNSAGSQFYVCLGDARFLDRQYTVFGQLTDGFETLDALRVGDRMESVTIEPVTAA